MLWMCLWMCPHHDTASLIDQAFGILLLRILGGARQQTTALFGGWGSSLIHNDTHFNVKHVKVIYNLHMLWMFLPDQDTASLIYQVFGYFWESWVVLGNKPHCHAVVEALHSFIMTFTSISNIYIRCLTTFICCGCAYGCVFLPGYSLSHLPSVLDILENPG